MKLCVAVDHNSQSTFTYQRYTHRRVHVILLKRVCAETSVLSFIHKSTHSNKQTCQKCYDTLPILIAVWYANARYVWRSEIRYEGKKGVRNSKVRAPHSLRSNPVLFARILFTRSKDAVYDVFISRPYFTTLSELSIFFRYSVLFKTPFLSSVLSAAFALVQRQIRTDEADTLKAMKKILIKC